MIRRHRLEAFWAFLLLAVFLGAGSLRAQITPVDPVDPITPVALAVSVPEVVQGKDIPALSAEADIAGQKTLSLALTSLEWTTKPGIKVTAVIEAFDGKDWKPLMAFTATSGLQTTCPSGPPCPLPSLSVSYGKMAEPKKVRITIKPSDVLSVGALATSSDKDLAGK